MLVHIYTHVLRLCANWGGLFMCKLRWFVRRWTGGGKTPVRLPHVFSLRLVRSCESLLYINRLLVQSELEVELLWGQLDRREKELNMSKIGAR